MKEDKEIPVPKWLKDLQQKSWEPEILLSGIVLYGMFKVPDLLDAFELYFEANIFGNSNDVNNLIGLSKMGIYWLITGLILHLICRGIWIGMVGLSYTFPQGIRKDKLSYQGKFYDKVDRLPAYEIIVIRLEKISSALFSVSFMLFMSLMGGYLYFFVLIILPFTVSYALLDIGFQGLFYDAFQVYVLIVVVLGIIGLVDFLSLGYFRRFKWVVKFYWPIHAFISTLTLSRFYRPIYYGVVSNFNKWLFFLFLLVFTVVSIIGTGTIASSYYPGESYSRLSLWDDIQGYNAFEGYYDDQIGEQFSVQAQIQSDVVTGNVLKLFIPANISYEDEMKELMPPDSLKEAHPDTSKLAINLMIIKSFYMIKLDGKPIEIERWYTRYKNKTGQFGYFTYIDISNLAEGVHHLSVFGNHNKFTASFANIPFYRDITFTPSQTKTNIDRGKEEELDFQPKPFGVRE